MAHFGKEIQKKIVELQLLITEEKWKHIYVIKGANGAEKIELSRITREIKAGPEFLSSELAFPQRFSDARLSFTEVFRVLWTGSPCYSTTWKTFQRR